MKKTSQTKKIVLDRSIIRELSPRELQEPNGGFNAFTGEKRTGSCLNGCPPCVWDIGG